jgi:nicotinate-nucleotide adenylyltransferase
MTFGFYGGSFDPIHFGHINLALELCERHRLQGVVFCPTAINPCKVDAPPSAAAHHRLKMVEIAIKDIPEFSLSSFECEKNGPCYTIDTLEYLIKQYPDRTWRLLMGSDSALTLPHWRRASELIALAPPLIGSREGGFVEGFPVEQIPCLDISSTEIRRRLSQKKYCKHLVPTKVLDYITLHQLY